VQEPALRPGSGSAGAWPEIEWPAIVRIDHMPVDAANQLTAAGEKRTASLNRPIPARSQGLSNPLQICLNGRLFSRLGALHDTLGSGRTLTTQHDEATAQET